MKIIYISLFSLFVAQSLKPIMYYIVYKKWNLSLLTASGGLPSSHSSLVMTLSTIVGLTEGFTSTVFSITMVFSIIVMYDAANVRYYAGKNIQLTKCLIRDLKKMDLYINKFTDPIYDERIKQILGHKWIEVFSGAVLGIIIGVMSYFILM